MLNFVSLLVALVSSLVHHKAIQLTKENLSFALLGNSESTDLQMRCDLAAATESIHGR